MLTYIILSVFLFILLTRLYKRVIIPLHLLMRFIMEFKKLTIPNQKNIYMFRTTLFALGLNYHSKKQYYYNPYDLEEGSKERIEELLKEHEYTYSWEIIKNIDFIKEIEYIYRIEILNETNFFIQKRSNKTNFYFVNLSGNNINITDLKKSRFFSSSLSIKEYEDVNLPMFTLKLLNKVANDFEELNKILSVLIDYNSAEFQFESRLNAFKFHIFGIVKEKMQDGFLCNCVDGFYPETNFYIRGINIYSDYLETNVSHIQEKKILKYLFVNRNLIGVRKFPTYKDLFLGKKLLVNTSSGESFKVIINSVYKNKETNNIKVRVYNGNTSLYLSREFTEEALLSRVISSR